MRKKEILLKKKSVCKKIAIVVVAVVLAVSIGTGIYLGDYYHSVNVDEALKSSDGVTVTKIKEGYFFDGAGEDKALIFYPGAKVEFTAYAPLMNELAAEGMDCFLVKMPGNLAILGSEKAVSVMEEYPYAHTYIGGHSLGGAMAASFAADHAKGLDGLLLLAAYSTKDLTESNLQVLSIVGTEDGVINREKLAEYAVNLPADATYVELEGGNHAGFGSYGNQKGDGTATITGAEQVEQVAELIFTAFF